MDKSSAVKSTSLSLYFALAFAILLGAILRALVIYSISYLYGPGDPFCYFEVAQNIYKGKGFTLDYIYHLLHLPASISHSMDYYEPVFPLTLAATFFVIGCSVISAKIVSLIAGICNLALVFLLTRKLFDDGAGLIATFLLVLHPVAIYHSGLVMKESLLVGLYLVFMIILTEAVHKSSSKLLFALGSIAGIISAYQYESIPVMIVPLLVIFFRSKGAKRLILTIGWILPLIAVIAFNLTHSGTLLGYKYLYFFGHESFILYLPEVGKNFSLSAVIGRLILLPIDYGLISTIKGLFLVGSTLAIIAIIKYRRLTYTGWLLLILLPYFYFHLVARNLYFRDYMVPYTLVLPLVAGLIISLIDYRRILGATLLLLVLFEYHVFCITGGYFESEYRSSFFSLPYKPIYNNLQFPWFNSWLQALDNAGIRIRELVAEGEPIMSVNPWEVHYILDRPTVMMSRDRDSTKIEYLKKRYAIRYILDSRPGEIALIDTKAREIHLFTEHGKNYRVVTVP